jgi:hypothetical protein
LVIFVTLGLSRHWSQPTCQDLQFFCRITKPMYSQAAVEE